MPSSHEPPNGGKEAARPRFVRLLRLIHPLPALKPKPRRRRHEVDVFTAEEKARLRLALKNAAKAAGGWHQLAAAMQCARVTLVHAANGRQSGVSAALAIRLARVTGFSLDAILTPGLHVVEPRPGPDGAA